MKQPLSFSGRRDFLKTGGAVTAGLLANRAVLPVPTSAALPPLPANPNTVAALPTRNLGKTGYKVGIFSLGGQAALERPNNFDIAVPIIERALDLGVKDTLCGALSGTTEEASEKVNETFPTA